MKKEHDDRSATKFPGDIPLLPMNPVPQLEGVRFFFTTRQHGVSQGGYASLNLADHVGDDIELVRQNRQRLMNFLQMPIEHLCLVRQVHGIQVHLQGESPPLPPPEGDALVTDQPGRVLGILTADCAPVLLADPVARVIGAAHAGWRGAIAGVVPSTLEAMASLGAKRERLVAVTGPCIGPAAFVVGPDVWERFLQVSAGYRDHFAAASETGRFLLDLPGFLKRQLLDNGLVPDRIHHAHLCTFSQERLFFSHRRSSRRGEGPCGRQMAGIFLA
ncbi:MAG: peptidoglycan editing factor PgeF [Magnetococcales bacterium]|nr:peptidoglycan editing factor PgeF [Magnetococcales bacterium]